MVEARVPEALVLLAVYCVALKRTGEDSDGHGELWWIEGKGESLLRAVGREMGKLGRRGGEGDVGEGRKRARESWERGGWEEWVRAEMGMEFR